MCTLDANKKDEVQKFAKESPCICFNVRRASKVITAIYERMFKPVGITAPQGTLLASIRELGPLTVNELAEAIATDRTTLTRNLKILERDGLIDLKPGEDKRVKKVVITEQGLKKSNQASALFKAFQQQLNQSVGQERIDALCQELSEVMDTIQKTEGV